MSSTSGSEDRAVFDALYKLHQIDSTVLVSNGTLERLRLNDELLDKLKEDERLFFDLSIEESDRSVNLQIAASQEYSDALIEAEERATELAKAKEAAEVAQIEATEAKDEAEELAHQLKRDKDSLLQELESTAMLQLQSDRMKWQFKTAEAHSPWMLGILVLFLAGIFVLYWGEKPGTDVLIPVLAAVLGAQYGAFAQAFGALYAPLIREEGRQDRSKRSEQTN